MTVMEFFGCAFLAFGPPLAMFAFTIANDPIRIIILIASSFFWLLSLLLSALFWFAVVPLQHELAFGLVFSVLFQELFRFFIYKLLRRAETGLQKVAENTERITSNKHILAYVAGLGFGVISGAFSLVNVLADAVGPATMGLKAGSQFFFVTSAATSLCFILLHTFWGVIFFSAADRRNYVQIACVVGGHMMASCFTLFNRDQLYAASLVPLYSVTAATGVLAFHVAGGSWTSLKAACSTGR
ncbi:gamma-secretase subunit Aph-1 [Bacillus rossius redtenbacheri]|uniref:gamma-secretase subunit Aph-1 n=1 Tax=Bacillus rossius redtenbacheri TaxID=93214 RepID=UPI002FDE671A